MIIQFYPSSARHQVDQGGFKTSSTFLYDQCEGGTQQGFRSVSNVHEHWIQPGIGLPLCTHQAMEIFFIVVEGKIAYQDDKGHCSILHPGQIHALSAGEGVTFATLNASDKEKAHFLQFQVWPYSRQLTSRHCKKAFSSTSWHNQWGLILSSDEREGSLPLYQDASVYIAHLEQNQELAYALKAGRFGWLQVIQGGVEVNKTMLEAGDGIAISQTCHFYLKAQSPARLVFIDLP